MRRVSIILLILGVLVALTAPTALAASPHFINASASGPNASGSLAVSFKIAGLGANETITITATADATAVYACQNNAGNFPSAANKQTVSGPVSDSGQFTSGKNGQITGSLTLSPPPSTLNCPSGQHEVLASVSYTNLQISATGVGATSIPGTFSRTFFTI
jgi:hypothetical protein